MPAKRINRYIHLAFAVFLFGVAGLLYSVGSSLFIGFLVLGFCFELLAWFVVITVDDPATSEGSAAMEKKSVGPPRKRR